jgi:hypothetical protein
MEKSNLNRQELIDNHGWEEMEHFTVMNNLLYKLSRRRHLSLGDMGGGNEILVISQLDNDVPKITDLIVISNYDYDGLLTMEKLISITEALTITSV